LLPAADGRRHACVYWPPLPFTPAAIFAADCLLIYAAAVCRFPFTPDAFHCRCAAAMRPARQRCGSGACANIRWPGAACVMLTADCAPAANAIAPQRQRCASHSAPRYAASAANDASDAIIAAASRHAATAPPDAAADFAAVAAVSPPLRLPPPC